MIIADLSNTINNKKNDAVKFILRNSKDFCYSNNIKC